MNNIFAILKRRGDRIGTYRMITHITEHNPVFIVQVCGILGWHTIKTFESDDHIYARNCAEELLDTLNEEI